MNDQVEDATVIGGEQPPMGGPEGGPNLSLNDIATFLNIIDACSERGAFKGRELEGVGQLRNKTEAFLRSQADQGRMPAEAVPGAPAAAPADVPEGPLADKVVG